jgi:peptidylprolyl isomerase
MHKSVAWILILVILIGGYFLAKSMKPKSYTDTATTTLNFGTDNSSTNAAEQTFNPNIDQANQVPTSTSNNKYMQATLHTNKGDITIEFDTAATPNTVANFEKLAGSGFYDGTKFHRIISGFMIQGGDPLSKDDAQKARWGTGGPGYQFADEIGANNHNNAGTIAMANAGPNTNGSQFFINLADNSYLDDKHTVFGKVVAGIDVVQAIGSTPTDSSDRPIDPVIIQSVELK